MPLFIRKTVQQTNLGHIINYKGIQFRFRNDGSQTNGDVIAQV